MGRNRAEGRIVRGTCLEGRGASEDGGEPFTETRGTTPAARPSGSA